MGKVLPRASARSAPDPRRILVSLRASVFIAALAIACAGCSRLKPVDTTPLVASGMSFDAVQQLKSLKISAPEVLEMAKARQGGFPDDDCVAVYKIYKGRSQQFDAGDAVAGLMEVGMSDTNVLQLARWNDLGTGWGELQAMKLAGMSDAIVMEEAQQHASGKSVLSGATLARLKNAGVHESTLLKLVERAVPESRGREILAYRRRGASETEILRHFTGS
jgi:hypothetical protein